MRRLLLLTCLLAVEWQVTSTTAAAKSHHSGHRGGAARHAGVRHAVYHPRHASHRGSTTSRGHSARHVTIVRPSQRTVARSKPAAQTPISHAQAVGTRPSVTPQRISYGASSRHVSHYGNGSRSYPPTNYGQGRTGSSSNLAPANMAGTTPRHNSDVTIPVSQIVPDRLTASQFDPATGKITWPLALKGPEFSEDRKKVDELFQTRVETGSGSRTDGEIRHTIKLMLERLKGEIHDLPANIYIAARKFLNGLVLEIGSPAP